MSKCFGGFVPVDDRRTVNKILDSAGLSIVPIIKLTWSEVTLTSLSLKLIYLLIPLELNQSPSCLARSALMFVEFEQVLRLAKQQWGFPFGPVSKIVAVRIETNDVYVLIFDDLQIFFTGDQHCTSEVVEQLVMKSGATFEAALNTTFPFAICCTMSEVEAVATSTWISSCEIFFLQLREFWRLHIGEVYARFCR